MVTPFVDLVTVNTRLRIATPADAAFIAAIENDSDLKRLIGGVSGKSEEDYRKSLARKNLRCLIVASLVSGTRIGRCGLLTDSESAECEIHIVMAKSYCQRGLGTEVVFALKQLAADMFPEKMLTAKVHPDNAPSLAIIAKLGLAPNGTISSEEYDNGWLKFRSIRTI
jgi:RimJ/RimL family protein N-acetyltransferase